jgi:hypothetical protein
LVFVLADLRIRVNIHVEIHVEVHVYIHILNAHVVCSATHLIEKGVLALRCWEEVVLRLE